MNYENVSAKFAALGDPTRLAILARLTKGDASVTELAGPFHMSMPAITKHLKVLENAGLISRGRDAQRRPCRIETKGLTAVVDLIEDFKKVWESRLDRLDEYLKELTAKEIKEKKNVRIQKGKQRNK